MRDGRSDAQGDALTFVGHSTVRLTVADTVLVTDPLLRSRVLHIRRRAAAPDGAVLAGVDCVLISHLHADHFDPPSLRHLDRDAPLIAPPGAGRRLARLGFRRTTELAHGDSARVGNAEIVATPAAHGGRRHPLAARTPAAGYEIRVPGYRCYFAGDTDLFPEMADLAGVDLALLPIAGWGPRVGPGHLDPRRAAEAAALIRPRLVVPIHWGTYLRIGSRAGLERLDSPPRRFARALAAVAPDVALRVLEPGQSMPLERRAA